MGKNYFNIKKQIDSSNTLFVNYLESSFNSSVLNFLKTLSSVSNIYIFSGVIRNFFMNVFENRDLDIYIDGEVDLYKYFKNYSYKENSYGGFKVNIDDTTIDVWFLRDTWAIKKHQLTLDFEIEKQIPLTAFFNFSSIVFSCKESRFYYSNHFLKFLDEKKIDIVFAPNPNTALCVVNTIYYSEKLNLKVSPKLKKYIKSITPRNISEFENVQKKHFGKILYSQDVLITKINNL